MAEAIKCYEKKYELKLTKLTQCCGFLPVDAETILMQYFLVQSQFFISFLMKFIIGIILIQHF